jgi:hypothetical protein
MTPAELKRMEEMATEGPWEAKETGMWPETNHHMGIYCNPANNGTGQVAKIEGKGYHANDNAALIVALRNHAKALIKVAEAARKVASLPSDHHPICNGTLGSGKCVCGFDDLRAALRELEEVR